MINTIEKGSWISENKKWKISFHIFNQDGLIQADITVFKINNHGKYDYFTSSMYNEKLPKYVAAEFEAIRNYVDSFRYPRLVEEQTEEVNEIIQTLQHQQKEVESMDKIIIMNICLIARDSFEVVINYDAFKTVSKMNLKEVKQKIKKLKERCTINGERLNVTWM